MQQDQAAQEKPGLAQGIARCISMMATHPFEKSKVSLQVHGQKCGLSLRGIFQTSFTSGLVYTTYFGLYESMEQNPWAATLASVLTAIIKIPLHNSIRVFYIMPEAKTVLECGKAIFQQNGVRGMYTGFRINVIEDIIETNIRDNLYSCIRVKNVEKDSLQGMWWNIASGAVCGSLGAAVTTPFDTLKSNLVYNASRQHAHLPFMQAVIAIYREKGGLLGLYRGVHLRALSSVMRYAVFYCCLLGGERAKNSLESYCTSMFRSGNQAQTSHNQYRSQKALPTNLIVEQ